MVHNNILFTSVHLNPFYSIPSMYFNLFGFLCLFCVTHSSTHEIEFNQHVDGWMDGTKEENERKMILIIVFFGHWFNILVCILRNIFIYKCLCETAKEEKTKTKLLFSIKAIHFNNSLYTHELFVWEACEYGSHSYFLIVVRPSTASSSKHKENGI